MWHIPAGAQGHGHAGLARTVRYPIGIITEGLGFAHSEHKRRQATEIAVYR